jgi:hypothetical protein
VRRGGLVLVMVGALSVSVRGQVQAVEPLLGGMSVVLALTNDLAALLALNKLMSTQRRAVGRGRGRCSPGGTAAGLNTGHAVAAGELPPPWAVVVGISPVLLAVVLSHLVALVLDDAPEQPLAGEAGSAGDPTAADVPVPRTVDLAAAAATRAWGKESSRAAPAPPAALSGSGIHHGLAVVPAGELPTPGPPGGGSSAARPRDLDAGDLGCSGWPRSCRRGVELTGASAAEQLGYSPRTGRRLLRQAEEYLASTRTPARTGEERGTG